ncbi:MAG: endonuclease MutS2, partial [Oscillospiraceae bacterium]
MTDRFQKSMNTLELPKVLALLSDQAVTEEGKASALGLTPSTDREEVRRRLAETSAAFRLLTLKGTPSLSGVRPVGAALQRADRGGTLNTRELLDIAGVLQCARNAKEYGEGAPGGVIDHFFRSLTPNKFLEEKITGTIVGEDEISDSASTLLADIRRHMRATASKVRDILNKLIASNQSKYLQESIITMRSDRYVVPVKAEHKNEVPGLVHDVSGSGGTFFIEPMG